MEYMPRSIYLENAWSLAKYNFYDGEKKPILWLTMIGEVHGMESYVYGKRKTISISNFCIRLLSEIEDSGTEVKILIEIENSLEADYSEQSNIVSIPIIEILNKISHQKIIGYNDRIQYIDEPSLYYTDNFQNLYNDFIIPFNNNRQTLLLFNEKEYYPSCVKYLISMKEKIITFFGNLTDQSELDDVRKAWAMVTDFNVLRILFVIREKPVHFIFIGGFAHSENIHRLLTQKESLDNKNGVKNSGISGARNIKTPMFYPDIDILRLNSAYRVFNI